LGVDVASDFKWNIHKKAHVKKIHVSLVFLKQLKRAEAGLNDLLHFYCCVIRPVLENSSPVWHSSPTVIQTKALDYLQKRAINIMFSGGIDYTTCLIMAGEDTLARTPDKTIFCRGVLPEY